MDNLIADSVYFFPETGVAAQQRWAEVERYLKDSLAADPGNLFASEFLANIAQVRNTSAQIRGFLHDLNSHIGGVKVRISELRKITAGSAEAELELDALSDAIQTLLSIATLTLSIEGKKPEEPPAEDLEDEDVAQVVSRAAELLGFKNVDVSYTGIPAKWPMWPALVRLAIGNLIRNADEAYHRRGKGYSGCPVSFFVDYVKKHVFCEDNAGGITPGLESTLFDPYVSEKGVTSNVGLGLSQARSAMLVQGFNLTLPCDQPRGGARFLLDFNERN
jgi:signal transduction histidine kinase